MRIKGGGIHRTITKTDKGLLFRLVFHRALSCRQGVSAGASSDVSAFFVSCRPSKAERTHMKIKYEFANETMEVEVSEEWGSIVVELDRQEYNANHRETRRHCSLEAFDLDGNLLPSKDDVEMDFIRSEENDRLHDAISHLNPRQQKLIKALYFEGRKVTDLAQEEGVHWTAITHAVERALKKLEKILK